MGYARYQTALGPAGYGVEDTCHEPGCEETIDRGLAHLCGRIPGSPDEAGCGEWFCGRHLHFSADCPGGQCERCLEAWERDREAEE